MERGLGEDGGGLRLYRRRWRTQRLGRCRGLIAAGGVPKAGGGESQSHCFGTPPVDILATLCGPRRGWGWTGASSAGRTGASSI